jgi:hypothetical protein
MIDGVEPRHSPRNAESNAGQDHPAPAPSPCLGAPPEVLVQAVLVDDRDTRLSARADRRRRVFAAFFRHQAESLREKLARAYAVVAEASEPDEYERLRTLLRTLQSVADACPPRKNGEA